METAENLNSLNDTNGYLRIKDLVRTPLPFLLQENSYNDLLNFTDDNGWNLLHWSVAQHKALKIIEFLNSKFTFSKSSTNNLIPQEIFKFISKRAEPIIPSIPFNRNGYTPVHLCVYLISEYEKIEDHTGNSPTHEYKLIFELIVEKFPDVLGYEDNDGLSVSDYCFLTESPYLIESLFKYDPAFTFLRKLKSETVVQILELMSKKYIKNKYNDHKIQNYDKILENIKKVNNKENLSKQYSKPKDNQAIVKI